MAKEIELQELNLYYEIVHEALGHYELSGGKIEFQGKSDNVTFKVTSETQDQQYLFKIHNQSSSFKMIESELTWVEALRTDTDLVVSAPCRNSEGNFVTEIKRDNKINYVTMQHWVEGEILDRNPTANEVQALGWLISTLHSHSQKWRIPEGFSRASYDVDQLLSSLTTMGVLVEKGIVTESVYNSLQETVNMMKTELASISKTNESWGLIHSDLHESNYVFYKGHVRPIDFSACGFGYYLFDIAETCLHLPPENRRLLVNAYREQQVLPDNYGRMLETFFLWGAIRGYAFHSANPVEYGYLSESVPAIVDAYCQEYLIGNHFLLNE